LEAKVIFEKIRDRIKLPPKTHVNKAPFRGILAIVDAPSDKSPSGARGHKVVLTKKAAEAALDSLIGMGIDYRPSWDGHNAQHKIGIIDSAVIRGSELIISGYLFKRDIPGVITQLQASSEYGMSYELADARVEDMREQIWRLTRVTFTGAAILRKDKAAYRMTNFSLLEEA
jgi:hypothetical protein